MLHTSLMGHIRFSYLREQGKKIMNQTIREKIIHVCNQKIDTKGTSVGLSFYAFLANKNDNPELLMEVATWWILTEKLDHFEKAVKIKKMVEAMSHRA